ncbi:unnamed protein product [Alternaria burnsii]|nr:unnamed protein product [Alternaria burnsii]
MDAFEKKTCKTARGYVYTYYTFEGVRSLPTLLFQHDWPDHAEMWKGIAERLVDTRTPIVILDMLCYDGTDEPTDPAEYRWDAMTKDLIDIIDTEQVDKVISSAMTRGLRVPPVSTTTTPTVSLVARFSTFPTTRRFVSPLILM